MPVQIIPSEALDDLPIHSPFAQGLGLHQGHEELKDQDSGDTRYMAVTTVDKASTTSDGLGPAVPATQHVSAIQHV